jgi:hypothetical protein
MILQLLLMRPRFSFGKSRLIARHGICAVRKVEVVRVLMSTVRKRSILTKRFFWSVLLLSIFLCNQAVFADSLFDFNEINAPKKKSKHAAAIDSYMEGLYGSDITVGPRAEVVNSSRNRARSAGGFSPASDAFLKSGRGKNSGITLSFDASPISSFSVDSQVFKRGIGLIIKADGVIIYQHLLTKAEKRSGIMDSIDPVFFDKPIHTLEFIGIKRTKIGIDNLEVNLSQPSDPLGGNGGTQPSDPLGGNGGNGGDSQFASVPEPSSLLMLGVGFLTAFWLARRSTSQSMSGTTNDQRRT